MGALDTKINEQICHLLYERTSSPSQKLEGYTMLRVKQAIDRAVKSFENKLTPENKSIWKVRPEPSQWIEANGIPQSATNTGTFLSWNYRNPK